MKPLNKLFVGGAMAGLALTGGAIGASMVGTADTRLEQGRAPGQRKDRDCAHW